MFNIPKHVALCCQYQGRSWKMTFVNCTRWLIYSMLQRLKWVFSPTVHTQYGGKKQLHTIRQIQKEVFSKQFKLAFWYCGYNKQLCLLLTPFSTGFDVSLLWTQRSTKSSLPTMLLHATPTLYHRSAVQKSHGSNPLFHLFHALCTSITLRLLNTQSLISISGSRFANASATTSIQHPSLIENHYRGRQERPGVWHNVEVNHQ